VEFKKHSELKDKHSYLSASKPAWLRYEPEQLIERVEKSNAAALGTRKHAFAAEAITLRQKLPNTNQTLNLYVNDAIGYRMTPEQPVFYSWYAFGTADALSFRREADGTRVLRIFDLKTGTGSTTFEQLIIYAAYFCLEYGGEYKFKPTEIAYDLRIYQNDSVKLYEPTPEEIIYTMSRIIESDKIIRTHLENEEWL
jgi:hypothetical protein